MKSKALRIVCLAGILAGAPDAVPQGWPPPARPPAGRPPMAQPVRPVARQPMRRASEMIRRQDPIVIDERILAQANAETTRIVVSLSKQRAYLLVGDAPAIDTPISSGKRAGMTPKGSFNIMEKDKNHSSNIYGDFRDSRGRIVRAGVSVRIDSAPSGTHFVGSPMKWFMRLTGDGVGMHIGILPGYPASHGCIRMPAQSAQMFYERVRVGTRVDVVQ